MHVAINQMVVVDGARVFGGATFEAQCVHLLFSDVQRVRRAIGRRKCDAPLLLGQDLCILQHRVVQTGPAAFAARQIVGSLEMGIVAGTAAIGRQVYATRTLCLHQWCDVTLADAPRLSSAMRQKHSCGRKAMATQVAGLPAPFRPGPALHGLVDGKTVASAAAVPPAVGAYEKQRVTPQ